ncbi:hypothetical protein Pmani_030098 [Petrolisthes manimaculis]|uniref:protein-tyrosine-phosphatase n=3 Tax=Petrolisthes manimaculis TaxID=1843537 RepID=A0AAE1TWC2_9EUCA|nr:hypothetical protein Pmani_030098 [Petrolisthes manimaculis]
MTAAVLHNLLTDGFYAPYAANPQYLLVVDCRDAKAFTRRRLASAYWYSALHTAPLPSTVVNIVLYDDRPRIAPPLKADTDPLAILYHDLRRQKLDPQIVVGGWGALQATCPHLLEGGDTTPTPEPRPWYPAQIIPDLLYLGQADMASDMRVLAALRVTHIVDVTECLPPRVLPAMNYLVVPLPEEPGKDEYGGTDLTSSLPTIMAFVSEAQTMGGCVLVHCDQGLTRAAAVVMGVLMTERRCTLEDAYYYVKGARSAVNPDPGLLQQLTQYESVLFGACLTQEEELF